MAKAQQALDGRQDEIAGAKRELFGEASRMSGSFWASQSFEELVELSQYVNPIMVQSAAYSREARLFAALERTAASPYFARIDFLFEGEAAPEKIYIGRATLTDGKGDMRVYDWRAPVASVFYRFGAGAAYYDAPQGRINGELCLKRQFEIKDGRLEYYFDADVQILDEFLRKLLSKNTSARMKTIVETIQKDQDVAIRDMDSGLLMVQGVAGSGKTSIGLHRVAYLMYQASTNRVSKNDIVILSPNTLFERYIENVLPELGEENVNSLVFEQLFEKLLKRRVKARGEHIEELISCEDPAHKALMKSSAAFKGSAVFAELLERFIEALPKSDMLKSVICRDAIYRVRDPKPTYAADQGRHVWRPYKRIKRRLSDKWIPFTDIYYAGELVAKGADLREKLVRAKSAEPLSIRLKKLEIPILEAVHDRRPSRIKALEKAVAEHPEYQFEIKERARAISIAESTALMANMRAFTELDCLALYRRLFEDRAVFLRLAKGLELPENIREIIALTRFNLVRPADDNSALPYEDALALSFLHQRLSGVNWPNIRQAVVDEAQDYYPMHFALLARLFSNARFTVLGDIDQTLEKKEDMAFYDGVRSVLNKEKATLVTMDKSFRCTNEILAFGARFLDNRKPESFNRGGDAPAIHAANSVKEMDELILREVEACKAKGLGSIALLTKTRRGAQVAYVRLKGRSGIKLALESGGDELTGAFVIPVFLSKGLEFDAVLILDADDAHYQTEDDKKLLYICSTRALHRLSVFAVGKVSGLIV